MDSPKTRAAESQIAVSDAHTSTKDDIDRLVKTLNQQYADYQQRLAASHASYNETGTAGTNTSASEKHLNKSIRMPARMPAYWEARNLYTTAEDLCVELSGVNYRLMYDRTQHVLELLLEMLRSDIAIAKTIDGPFSGSVTTVTDTMKGLLAEAKQLLRENGVSLPSLESAPKGEVENPKREVRSLSFTDAFSSPQGAKNPAPSAGGVRRSSPFRSSVGGAAATPSSEGGRPQSGQRAARNKHFESPKTGDSRSHPNTRDNRQPADKEDANEASAGARQAAGGVLVPHRPSASDSEASLAAPGAAACQHQGTDSSLPVELPPELTAEQIHLIRTQKLRELYGQWYAADSAMGGTGGAEHMLRDLLGLAYTHEYDVVACEGESPERRSAGLLSSSAAGGDMALRPASQNDATELEVFGACKARFGDIWDKMFKSLAHFKAGAGVDEAPIRSLYLTSCIDASRKPNAAVLEALQNVQQERQVESLQLSKSNLGDLGVEVLASILPRLYRLRSLDLSNNDLSDEALWPLAAALSFHPSLESIVLDNNNFTDACMPDIVQLIHTIPRLRTVSLEGCPISSLRPSAAITAEAFDESQRLSRQRRELLASLSSGWCLLPPVRERSVSHGDGVNQSRLSAMHSSTPQRHSPLPRLCPSSTNATPYRGRGGTHAPLALQPPRTASSVPAGRLLRQQRASESLTPPRTSPSVSTGVYDFGSSQRRASSAYSGAASAGERQVAQFLRRQVGVSGGINLPHIAAARQHLGIL